MAHARRIGGRLRRSDLCVLSAGCPAQCASVIRARGHPPGARFRDFEIRPCLNWVNKWCRKKYEKLHIFKALQDAQQLGSIASKSWQDVSIHTKGSNPKVAAVYAATPGF
jgi:hypothetical protein